jgi:hypothetical protein
MHWSESAKTRIRYQLETAGELRSGLSESQLRQRSIPDKWSAFEQLAHLASYQEHFLFRIQSILQDQEPRFGRYVAEEDPEFEHYLQKSLALLSDDSLQVRGRIRDLLLGLPAASLKRKGLHPVFGALDLTQWTEFFLLHEAHHLYALFRLCQSIRLQEQP